MVAFEIITAVFLASGTLASAAPTRAIYLPVSRDDAGGTNARMIRTGIIIAGGIECPLAALDDGRVYALSGAGPITSQLKPGTRIKLEGVPVGVSVCMQGQTLHVIDLKILIDPLKNQSPIQKQEN